MDVNQPPLIANQQGHATGVAGVQGSTGLEDQDGLRLRRDRLHPGHLLAATGVAAGTKGDGVAAASGACGSGAAAEAVVRGYNDAPVRGAGADLQGPSPDAFRPHYARAGSPLGPLAEGMGYPLPEGGGGVAGAEGPSGGLWSRGGDGDTSGGRQPPAVRGAAGASAFGTCGSGGPPEAAGLAAPDARPGDSGAGVAMHAKYNGFVIDFRRQVAVALWPGLAAQMSLNQSQQVLLHTGCTPAAARQADSSAQQQEEEVRVYPVTLVRYRTTGFRLTGVMAAVRELGVGNEEDVGLRRLPCGRVVLERWWQQDQEQGQDQEGEDMQPADSQDDWMPSDDADECSDEEYAPSPKRRRLQWQAPGGCGTGRGLWAQAQQGVQSSALEPQQGTATGRAPVRSAAAAAGGQLCHEVRYSGSHLRPTVAAVHALWPQLIARLKRSPGTANSIQVTLHTCGGAPPPAVVEAGTAGMRQAVGGGPGEQHAVQLSYVGSAKVFRVLRAGDVLAALGLRGEGVLQLRRTPDGRVWAEHAAGPDVTPAQQQPAPGLAAPPAPAAMARSYSPLASPAPNADAPHPVLRSPAAISAAIATFPLCVSGGYLHLDRPTLAALWPECVDMPVATQQLVRMRAVVEPGGGGSTAAAAAAAAAASFGPSRRSVTHYGTQLARLGPAVWRLEGTHALLRELRLGEGDRVELVPLEGGVVGVRRAGPEAEEASEGQRVASGDRAAMAAAGGEAGGRWSTGVWTGEAGGSKGEAVGSGGQGVGDVPAASAHAAWLKGLVGAAYEEGWHEERDVLSGADQHQQ